MGVRGLHPGWLGLCVFLLAAGAAAAADDDADNSAGLPFAASYTDEPEESGVPEVKRELEEAAREQKQQRRNGEQESGDSDKSDDVRMQVSSSKSSEAIPLDFDGNSCIIFAAEEGDRDRCHCPEGYVLCSWMDVREVQLKLEAASLYVDYEVYIRCSAETDTDAPSFEYKHLPGVFVTSTELEKLRAADAHASPRSCHKADFYLCRPAAQEDNAAVDCLLTEWSEWQVPCIDNIQRRSRNIIRSGQWGGKPCLWNGQQPRLDTIREERACPQELVATQIVTTTEEVQEKLQQEQELLKQGKEELQQEIEQQEKATQEEQSAQLEA
ncbi:secreted protein with altered thrombospondin repeat [Cyclospora cayetanensis]|uniref:Secreted protein with altered thrombospondin repeat n=1 Tax=Cyclospora cayetanensis TaxID=88456 RepID=A0A1D3D1Z2_9EIME|nr:secreted protein with altered thrombospondin repeat [Cyclospora cayetanensis]